MVPQEYKIGSGYDVHRLVAGRPLVMGGVTLDFDRGLEGHSDADVLVHAVCDAILGALGLGDIGDHFPDTDRQYRNISSLKLLAACRDMLETGGYEIVNMDCIVLAQVPKIGPYKKQMAKNMAGVLKMDASLVNVKATTTERLGFIGREEGIASQCSILIRAISGKQDRE